MGKKRLIMQKIEEILKEKILILDGAMGTMIQQYNFTEEDFRGERFKDFPVSTINCQIINPIQIPSLSGI